MGPHSNDLARPRDGLPSIGLAANNCSSARSAMKARTILVDSNGNLQRCATAGTSGSGAPIWSTSLNTTTTDGSAVWTLIALHTAPGPLIAHVSVPAFAYTGTGNYSGTWTLTF